MPELKLLYSVREAASVLGCDTRSLRRLLDAFGVVLVMVGKRSFIHVSDLVHGDSRLVTGARAVLKSRGYTLEPSLPDATKANESDPDDTQ